MADPPRYALDTQILYWYWQVPERLSRNADRALLRIEKGEATGIVSLVVIAELYYLFRRLRKPSSMGDLISIVDSAPALELEPLGRTHLVMFDQLSSINEMHDRLVAATALVHDCPLITADADLRASREIETIW